MSIQREEEQSRATQSDDVNIILPLATIDRTLLPIGRLLMTHRWRKLLVPVS